MIFVYFCSEHSERIYVKEQNYFKQKYGIFDAYKNN